MALCLWPYIFVLENYSLPQGNCEFIRSLRWYLVYQNEPLGKDGGREGGMEGEKEGGREGEREGGREGWREGGRAEGKKQET